MRSPNNLFIINLTLFVVIANSTLIHKTEYPDFSIVKGIKSTVPKPWLCSIWLSSDICACSILNSTTILTSAHCMNSNLPPSMYKIGVGSLDKTSQIKYQVKSYIVHPLYGYETKFNYDVCIITLEEPIIFEINTIESITLDSKCDDGIPFGSIATIQGWGQQNSKFYLRPTELYEAEVKIIKPYDFGCKRYYKSGRLSNTMICAGHPLGKIDPCVGDSGGPLVNEYGEQIGIVSWGTGCATPSLVGVYTYICSVEDWIINPIDRVGKNGLEIEINNNSN